MKKMTKGKKDKMTAVEAGRKGGKAMRDAHDHDWYVAIGRKGGQIVKDAFAALKREEAKRGRSGRVKS